VELNPRSPTYRQFRRHHYSELTETLVRRGDHAEAAKTTAELLPYDAAGFLARCVPLVQKDTNLSEAEHKDLAQKYGDRVMQLLREALKQADGSAPDLKKDPRFDSLRLRDDFKKLLADLEATKC
jgi:hypothetical protein